MGIVFFYLLEFLFNFVMDRSVDSNVLCKLFPYWNMFYSLQNSSEGMRMVMKVCLSAFPKFILSFTLLSRL